MVKLYDEPKSPSVYGMVNETMNKWHLGKCKYTSSITSGSSNIEARV